ncbi:MAG: hypothetical protein ACI906_004199 [Candidatus Latescibacterota bacterium]|jgi:hypothetical protein
MAEEKMGKVIGNVGHLDLRNASEESVAQIRRIGNVGAVLYSPETAHLLPRLNIGNVGGTLCVPQNAKIVTGEAKFDHSYPGALKEPISLVIVGQLLVEKDVTAEDIENKVDQLFVVGQVVCPQSLMGAINGKMAEMTGQMLTYGENAHFHMGQLTIDKDYLQGLEDGAEVHVLGKVNMPHILDEALLKTKLAKLQVLGKIQCREENMATLRAALVASTQQPKISFVPAGFEAIDRRLDLNNTTLPALPSRQLYCTGLVVVDGEVEAKALDEALDALVITRLLIAPTALKEVLVKKCNMLETKAVFYEGELWHIEDKSELLSSRFDYLAGKATLVVRDELHISPAIEPKLLAERLEKIHLFAEVYCTPEQMGAIQARLGINEGELIDPARVEREVEEEGMGNIGHLAL